MPSDPCTVTSEAIGPGVCGAPDLTERAGPNSVTVSWAEPDYNGGAPVLDYELEMVRFVNSLDPHEAFGIFSRRIRMPVVSSCTRAKTLNVRWTEASCPGKNTHFPLGQSTGEKSLGSHFCPQLNVTLLQDMRRALVRKPQGGVGGCAARSPQRHQPQLPIGVPHLPGVAGAPKQRGGDH